MSYTISVSFLNRTEELGLLERLWTSRKAEFLVLYGRRRLGKTELLAHFAGDRRAIYLEATDVRAEDQLRDFASAYADGLALGAIVPEVRDWRQLLDLVAEAAGAERTLVVFDEFQYLAKQEPGLGSLLSSWWRTTGRTLNLVLILSGSDISFFADEVLSREAPLHGRRTADYRLLPFTPADAALFLPNWSAEDRIRAYAIWGGVPYYEAMIDPQRSIAENILDTILTPGAPLQNEADYLIRMESRLRDTALYGSILRGIAAGRTSVSDLVGYLRASDAGNLSRQLERLERVGLISSVRPVTAARRTDIRYAIADPFLRFWFRFVAPAGGRLASRERAKRYLETRVLPRLEDFASMPAFEEICQADLLARVDAAAVGRWWGPIQETERSTGKLRTVQREADAVAIDDDGRVLALGTCKWTNSPVSISEINKLRRIAAKIAPEDAVQLVVYARTGVDDRVAAESLANPEGLQIVTPADLYP